ncbi:hypothetical protein Goshw_013723 [Gossypium schwendimanii]|uniref:NADP-dependent oxidoreductase domain-containing protein n=1 Tax=Gossypium schwendimanii TaxID=34291 RepID=A0A7J9L9V2_GOSSC|nr:hypothetical protein [Gossypium schwendimanii]
MDKEPEVQHSRVKLGSQGLEVSRLGFGCVGLSGVYNAPLSHEEGCSIIKEAFNRGITFFDTADIYGEKHDNEIMLGKALKQLPREKIQVATKFGFVKSESKGHPLIEVKGRPQHVRACCEASLERLDVDYIDLYFQHRVDTSVPIEDTVLCPMFKLRALPIEALLATLISFDVAAVYLKLQCTLRWQSPEGSMENRNRQYQIFFEMGELKKLVEEGKIKYIGLSEPSIDTIKRAHKVHPITALQMEYSLWTREIEDEIIPLCRELGIGIVAYSPLGRGFFGGKGVEETMPNESQLANYPRFNGENLEKNKLLYTRVSNLAIKHGCTVPQLALAWLLHQGRDIVPIPGTTKVKNMINNVGSLGLKLSEEDVKEICDAVPVDEVSGRREMRLLSEYTWKLANTPLK